MRDLSKIGMPWPNTAPANIAPNDDYAGAVSDQLDPGNEAVILRRKPTNADTTNGAPASENPAGTLSATSQRTVLDPGRSGVRQPAQDARSLLHRFRMRFSGVPVFPLPDNVVGALLAQNIPTPINFPDQTVAVKLTCDQICFVALAGVAGPFGAAKPNGPSFLLNPGEDAFFFVGNQRQISVLTAAASGNFAALCYQDKPVEYGN